MEPSSLGRLSVLIRLVCVVSLAFGALLFASGTAFADPWPTCCAGLPIPTSVPNPGP